MWCLVFLYLFLKLLFLSFSHDMVLDLTDFLWLYAWNRMAEIGQIILKMLNFINIVEFLLIYMLWSRPYIFVSAQNLQNSTLAIICQFLLHFFIFDFNFFKIGLQTHPIFFFIENSIDFTAYYFLKLLNNFIEFRHIP